MLVKKKCQMSPFRIHKIGNRDEKRLKKKRNELSHNTVGFIVAELEDVKDHFHNTKSCTVHLHNTIKPY